MESSAHLGKRISQFYRVCRGRRLYHSETDDEELKKTAKQAFIVTLIFTAISMFLSLYNNFGGMADNYYTSAGYQVYSILLQLTNIAKIVVYVVFGAIAFFGGNAKAVPHAEEKKEEENKEEGKI